MNRALVIPKKNINNLSLKLKLVIPAPACAGINYGRNPFLRMIDSRLIRAGMTHTDSRIFSITLFNSLQSAFRNHKGGKHALVRIDPGNQQYSPGWPDHPQHQESFGVWCSQFHHRRAIQLTDPIQRYHGRVVKAAGLKRAAHLRLSKCPTSLKIVLRR
jgi:hypothetical protein